MAESLTYTNWFCIGLVFQTGVSKPMELLVDIGLQGTLYFIINKKRNKREKGKKEVH